MVTNDLEPPPSIPQATLGTPSALVVVPQPVWLVRVKVSSMVLALAVGVGVDVAVAAAAERSRGPKLRGGAPAGVAAEPAPGGPNSGSDARRPSCRGR